MNQGQLPPSNSLVSLDELLRKFTARWHGRGLLLYFLPLPLVPALFVSLVRGDLRLTAVNLGSLVLLLLGAALNRRGLAREREYEAQTQARAPWPPWKILGWLCVAAGVGISSWLTVGNGLVFSLVLALLALLGLYLAYDLDPLRDKGLVTRSSAFARTELGRVLAEAEAKIAAIEAAAAQLASAELRERLGRVAALGRKVLVELERDPDDLRRARKFLGVYLDDVRRVTVDYAATMARANSTDLENRFRDVLIVIEQAFGEQHEKLIANDLLDLDVRMEVLHNRLKQEGIG